MIDEEELEVPEMEEDVEEDEITEE